MGLDLAQDFEARAALAEVLAYQPLDKPLSHLAQIAEDAERFLPLPDLNVPLRREHHERMAEIARRLSAVATLIRVYSRETK